MKIVIGLPAFNEEKNIASIILKLKKITDMIIVCNDGSTDMTGDIAEKMGAVLINHPKNMGYGAAIRSLFKKSNELSADILVTFDADGQHQVEDILRVIEYIKNDEADLVIGSRFIEKEQSEIPYYRRIGIKALTRLANTSLESKITDSQSGFRAYNKQVLSEIIPSDNGMGVSNEILIKASKRGFRIKEVPIIISYDGDTSTHNPVSHGASVVLSTMKFVSIEHPLKFYGIPGVVFLALGLFFSIWTIQVFSESGKIITNIALIGVGSSIIGIILLITAILLFSLVSIVREVKN